MTRYAKASIDLSAFRHNFSQAAKLAGSGNAVAVIKANAYGHGAVPLAKALPEATMFAVASLEEAIELREAGIDKPLLLLAGFFAEEELAQIAQFKLTTAIHNQQQLEQLLKARLSAPLDVWLKLDCGMHRLGFTPAAFRAAYQRLRATDAVGNIVLMSHFACADEPSRPINREQLAMIQENFTPLEAAISTANSAALLTGLAANDNRPRPGIMLYGSNPVSGDCPAASGLQPVMTLHSRIMAIHELAAGEGVGYGHTWKSQQPARIGTIAMGYADGYPRHAPSGTPVLVNGRSSQLVGRVCMDMLSVDLSHLPDARVGDPVELWGKTISVDQVAAMAGTISYELLAGITARVPREYV